MHEDVWWLWILLAELSIYGYLLRFYSAEKSDKKVDILTK